MEPNASPSFLRTKSKGFFSRKSLATLPEDYIQLGVEARKKAKNATRKGSSQEAQKFFQESVEALRVIVLDKEQENSIEYGIALYELGRSYFEHASVLTKPGFAEAKSESETQWTLLEKSLEYLKRVPPDSSSPESDETTAKVMTRLAQRKLDTRYFKEAEDLLIEALEKQNQAIKRKDQKNEDSYSLLQEILQLLSNGEKARQKQGKATYVICGDFVKQGGNYKSWKKRFFVVDDSTISYFKNKKDWEVGPVAGNAGKPCGVIKFSEVQNISFHGKVCPMVRPDKRPSTVLHSYCFHIHTPDRIYHILSLPETSDQEVKKWPVILTDLMRSFKAKKTAKSLLKKNQSNTKKKRNSIHSEEDEEDVHSINEESSEEEEEEEASTVSLSSTNNNSSIAQENPLPDRQNRISIYGDNKSKILKPKETTDEGFTQSKLKIELDSMTDDEVVALLKTIFKQYESEGQLRKLFQALASEDPKEFILKLTNVGNFQLAKFGVLQRVGENIHKQTS